MDEEKHNKKDSKIISEMRKIRKEKPVLDKEYEKLSKDCENAFEEFDKLVSDMKKVMRESDKIIKITKEKLGDDKKKKSTNFNKENIKNWIAEVLFNKNLISKELYLKCDTPNYIKDLPGDLRSHDPDLLYERLSAIEEELDNRENILKKAEYRIGVKTRDSERLAKRIEKNIANADKALDSIAKESDRIVKNISKLEDKINKIDDETVKDNLNSALDKLKKAHNNFYDMDLTGDNIQEYKKSFEDYSKASTDFNNAVKDASSYFNKTDLKNSDSSSNLKRIDKGITNFEKSGKNVTSDVEKVGNNQRDIDYIVNESNGVSKSIDILLDEFERTYNYYIDNTNAPKKVSQPNPQMMVNISSKQGDNFSLLPNNYEVYMV